MAAIADLQAACARLAGERDALRQQVTVMMTPCRCDPLWSGEAYCNGGCELRAERDTARAALATIAEKAATWEDSLDPWESIAQIEQCARRALEGK